MSGPTVEIARSRRGEALIRFMQDGREIGRALLLPNRHVQFLREVRIPRSLRMDGSKP